MRLVFALICARALALPHTRGRSLEPGDLERGLFSTWPKCCHCGEKTGRSMKESGCWKDAGLAQDAKNPLKKESCEETCADYGGNHGIFWPNGMRKVHISCAEFYKRHATQNNEWFTNWRKGGGKICRPAMEPATTAPDEDEDEPEEEAALPSLAQIRPKLALLVAAHDGGALSERLFVEAQRELILG